MADAAAELKERVRALREDFDRELTGGARTRPPCRPSATGTSGRKAGAVTALMKSLGSLTARRAPPGRAGAERLKAEVEEPLESAARTRSNRA